jgi:DNA-binding transcriptional LysR family regulator
MHILSLERDIDLRLFIRSKKRVLLSPEGEIMRKTFIEVIQRINNGRDAARELHRKHADIIHIGYMQGLDTKLFFNEIIDTYRRMYPETEFEIVRLSNNAIIDCLNNRIIDVGFTLRRIQLLRPDFSVGSLYKAQVSIMCAEDRFREDDKPLEIRDFEGATFIVLQSDEDPTEQDKLKEILRENCVTAGGVMEVTSIESQILNVEMGMGVALSSHMSRVYNKKRLRFVDIPGQIEECVWISNSDHQNPVVKRFEEYLTANRT